MFRSRRPRLGCRHGRSSTKTGAELSTTLTLPSVTAHATTMAESVAIITTVITFVHALQIGHKLARRVRDGTSNSEAVSERIERSEAIIKASLRAFGELQLLGNDVDVDSSAASLPKRDYIPVWADQLEEIASLSQSIVRGVSQDFNLTPSATDRIPRWMIKIKRKEYHDKWRNDIQVASSMLATILGPVHLKNFEILANTVCPSLSRIEDGQKQTLAGQISIQKQVQELKDQPIPAQQCIPIPSPSTRHTAIPTPAKSSALIPILERSGFSLRYFAVRAGASKYGLVARVKIGQSLALVAEISGHFFLNPFLLRPGLSISFRGVVPEDSEIFIACLKGHSLKVQQLLTAGVARPDDCTPSNKTLLSAAIMSGDLATVEVLLHARANVNLTAGKFQTSPVQLSTRLGHPNITRTLIRYDADLDYLSDKGWSILHHIFEKYNPHSTVFMVMFSLHDVSFDPAKDFSGWNALHRCAAVGTGQDVANMVKLFGAQKYLDIRNAKGSAPVHVAAKMGNTSTLEALLESNAEQSPEKRLNVQDDNGWTPLHHSINSRKTDTMRWLIQQGADYGLPTFPTARQFPAGHDQGVFYPDDLARIQGKDTVSEYLSALQQVRPDASAYDDEIFYDSTESEKSEDGGEEGSQKESLGFEKQFS